MVTKFTMSESGDSRFHKVGATSSGLLINGLVALVIGLAALIGDLVFKNLMGNVGYIVIAILSAILIIMGAIRTVRALRIKSVSK